jgi:type I restriction enzyme S subunit
LGIAGKIPDALIQSMEKLIAKERNIKQGAMQELLTGRTRLV